MDGPFYALKAPGSGKGVAAPADIDVHAHLISVHGVWPGVPLAGSRQGSKHAGGHRAFG
ncbi:MAG: hypothetical protein KGR48_13740 [Alphaproteobacteria bacterium]|nr:hypothetical protein [Alphaproteobacteria bacterium]